MKGEHYLDRAEAILVRAVMEYPTQEKQEEMIVEAILELRKAKMDAANISAGSAAGKYLLDRKLLETELADGMREMAMAVN